MINQILPVFIIIAFGFFLSLIKIADDSWVRILNRFGLYVGFPILLFANLITIDRKVLCAQIPTFLTTIAIITIVMIVIFSCIKLFHVPTDKGITLFLGGFNGNVGYLGFPLITAVSPGSGATISLIIAAYGICLFTIGLFLLESITGKEKNIKEILRYMVTSPFLIAIGAGLFVSVLGINIHPTLLKAIDMIEASAAPVVLIGLGIFMNRKIQIRALAKPLFVILAVKLLVFPSLFIAAGKVFSFDQLFNIAILEASMPLAITNFALSDRYPMDKELMVSAIVVSTLLTPLIFPLYTMLL